MSNIGKSLEAEGGWLPGTGKRVELGVTGNGFWVSF